MNSTVLRIPLKPETGRETTMQIILALLQTLDKQVWTNVLLDFHLGMSRSTWQLQLVPLLFGSQSWCSASKNTANSPLEECYYGMSYFRATYLPRGGRNQLTIWGLLLIICISIEKHVKLLLERSCTVKIRFQGLVLSQKKLRSIWWYWSDENSPFGCRRSTVSLHCVYFPGYVFTKYPFWHCSWCIQTVFKAKHTREG